MSPNPFRKENKMGTRNLTIVVADGEHKVAQYAQWDGYPSGQGVTALAFCREHLTTEDGVAAFKDKLAEARYLNEDDRAKLDEFLKSIGSENGWMNMDQAELYKLEYPYLSRDHGADILELILKHGAHGPQRVMEKFGTLAMPRWKICAIEKEDVKPLLLEDSTDFIKDSLFCEFAYVIDLDEGTFEVYEGFNKEPVPPGQRFSDTEPNDGKYYPCKLMAKWPLNELPTEEAFLAQLVPPDEDEDE